jgi:stearoyl-CoA desaturase (Delta-9 desaturase)
MEIAWRNVIGFIYLHGTAIYALTLTALPITWIISKKINSTLYPHHFKSSTSTATYFAAIGAFGISSGAHRLWCHKSYKANLPMRVMLLFFQTIAFQNCVIEWVRDHRVHHKFSDTNADPHNANRGFFFSHIGWLMCKKHPDVRKYGSRVDMSDLESDKMLKFQEK